jgi:hypothetical protein
VNPRLAQQLQRNKRVFVDTEKAISTTDFGQSRTTRHNELKFTKSKQPR